MIYTEFLNRKVLVKTWDGIQTEGVLQGIERSHHGGPVGNVILKTENGFTIVRGDLWAVVALEKGGVTAKARNRCARMPRNLADEVKATVPLINGQGKNATTRSGEKSRE